MNEIKYIYLDWIKFLIKMYICIKVQLAVTFQVFRRSLYTLWCLHERNSKLANNLLMNTKEDIVVSNNSASTLHTCPNWPLIIIIIGQLTQPHTLYQPANRWIKGTHIIWINPVINHV